MGEMSDVSLASHPKLKGGGFLVFLRATLSQIRFLLRQTSSIVVFFVLFGMVIANYITNVLTFQGTDVSQMIHPMKLLLLSYNHVYTNVDFLLAFIQLYPLLVVFPAGFALAKERQLGLQILMEVRLGRCGYLFSKIVSVFCVTTIVFSTPFLLEIILNCIAFPWNAAGDFSLLSAYDPEYFIIVGNYMLKGLYRYSPYLYAAVGTLLFGLLSGLLSVFTVSISSVLKIRFRIVLFLPVFILLNLTSFLSDVFTTSFSVNWFNYFLLFDSEPKSILFFILGILAIITCSACCLYRSTRLDGLQ